MYQATFDTIKHVAGEGPCVIIGRCADYALAGRDNMLSLFIHAPLERRIAAVARWQNLDADRARQQVLRTDKRRAAYYEYYSSKKWGSVDSYNFCLTAVCSGRREPWSSSKRWCR